MLFFSLIEELNKLNDVIVNTMYIYSLLFYGIILVNKVKERNIEAQFITAQIGCTCNMIRSYTPTIFQAFFMKIRK